MLSRVLSLGLFQYCASTPRAQACICRCLSVTPHAREMAARIARSLPRLGPPPGIGKTLQGIKRRDTISQGGLKPGVLRILASVLAQRPLLHAPGHLDKTRNLAWPDDPTFTETGEEGRWLDAKLPSRSCSLLVGRALSPPRQPIRARGDRGPDCVAAWSYRRAGEGGGALFHRLLILRDGGLQDAHPLLCWATTGGRLFGRSV